METSDISCIRRCSAIVNGFNASTPEGVKEQSLHQVFSKGGAIRWVSPYECVVVLTSAALLDSICVTTPARLTRMESLTPAVAATYDSVATDLYNSIKPERSTTVANRLIGAALGKKIPVKQSVPVPKVQSPPVLDAWDD